MKLAQLQEARYAQDPVINFIKKVEIGTNDYTQFPRKEIPQVVDAITRTFGEPKHEPRRTQFGGDVWREWYWEVDNPDSYLNITITIPKRVKGEKRVARLSVENYEYEDEPDEHGYVDEALTEAKYYLQHKAWIADWEDRAAAEREAGGSVEINYGLPYISIKTSDGRELFYQGEDAERALEDVPDELSPEDYFMAQDF